MKVGVGQYWHDPAMLELWWSECMKGVKDIMVDMLKETNPKDAVGSRKWRQYCVVPARVVWEVALAHLVGALKYGRHNWRVAGISASVYRDAALGHIDQWWEGEDLDPETQANHIAHAIAGLNILLDSILRDDWNDDRPPKTEDMDLLRKEIQIKVDRLFRMYPNPVTPVTELNKDLDLPEWYGGQTKEPPEEEGVEVKWKQGEKTMDWDPKFGPSPKPGVIDWDTMMWSRSRTRGQGAVPKPPGSPGP